MQNLRTHQGGVTLDLLVHPLEQVCARGLPSVFVSELLEGLHVFPGCVHLLRSLGEVLDQRAGQVIPARFDHGSCPVSTT